MRVSGIKKSTGGRVWIVFCGSTFCGCLNTLETDRQLTDEEINELGWEVYHLSTPSETFCPSHHANRIRHAPGCGENRDD